MKLPSLCIQDEIPVTEGQIPAQEVKIVRVNTDVGLLIGNDASDLMEPWKVISSRGNGPHAGT